MINPLTNPGQALCEVFGVYNKLRKLFLKRNVRQVRSRRRSIFDSVGMTGGGVISFVGVMVGFGDGVGVGDDVFVLVGVLVGTGVNVGIFVGVLVAVNVNDGVLVGVLVGVFVEVGVEVGVGV